MKHTQASAQTRPAHHIATRRSAAGRVALVGFVLAAAGGPALAETAPTTLSASGTIESSKRNASETYPRAPSDRDGKPVVGRDAARKPAPVASPSRTVSDVQAAELEMVKSTFGWFELPDGFAAVQTEQQGLDLARNTYGWLALPDGFAAASEQQDRELARSTYEWFDVASLTR